MKVNNTKKAISLKKVSFEFFPPNDKKMEKMMWRSIEKLSPLDPSFVSVTYTHDEIVRQRTHQAVKKLTNSTSLCVAPHLTCVGATKEAINSIAKDYWNLKSDAKLLDVISMFPKVEESERSFESIEVESLKKIADFDISVAAYPEIHPESKTRETDIDNLKRKIDVDRIVLLLNSFLVLMSFCIFVTDVQKKVLMCLLFPEYSRSQNSLN